MGISGQCQPTGSGTDRLHRRSLMAAASSTTVPPGSRLVGLVGEAPLARLDEAEST
jgi:hypothetical protein